MHEATGGAPITRTRSSDKCRPLGHAHRTMGVQDPLCNAAATDTSGTGDHIPQGVPKWSSLNQSVQELQNKGAIEPEPAHPRLLQPLVPCLQGNRGVEADHRSVLPQCLRALHMLAYAHLHRVKLHMYIDDWLLNPGTHQEALEQTSCAES